MGTRTELRGESLLLNPERLLTLLDLPDGARRLERVLELADVERSRQELELGLENGGSRPGLVLVLERGGRSPPGLARVLERGGRSPPGLEQELADVEESPRRLVDDERSPPELVQVLEGVEESPRKLEPGLEGDERSPPELEQALDGDEPDPELEPVQGVGWLSGGVDLPRVEVMPEQEQGPVVVVAPLPPWMKVLPQDAAQDSRRLPNVAVPRRRKHPNAAAKRRQKRRGRRNWRSSANDAAPRNKNFPRNAEPNWRRPEKRRGQSDWNWDTKGWYYRLQIVSSSTIRPFIINITQLQIFHL